jgi:hypothetical protein
VVFSPALANSEAINAAALSEYCSLPSAHHGIGRKNIQYPGDFFFVYLAWQT